MKKSVRRNIASFSRAFTLTLMAILLPVMLISGITRADKNTRATGFSDRDPVFEVVKDGNDLVMKAFGYSLIIDEVVIDAAKGAANFCTMILPSTVKAFAWILQSLPALVADLTG